DNLGTLTNEYYSVLAGHTLSVGTSAVNEFVFQYSKFDNSILPNSDNPTLLYPSGVTVGQNINTPQTTMQTKWQFKDAFSFSKTIGGRRHDLKVGASYLHEPRLGGDIGTGVVAPQYTLLEDRVDSPV